MNNISIFLVIFFILFTNVVNAEEKISEKDINILEKEFDSLLFKEKTKKQSKVQNPLENKFKTRSKLFNIQLLDKLENYRILKENSYKDKTPTIVLKGFRNYEEYFKKIYKIDVKNKIYLIEPEIKNSVFQKILVATFEYKKNKIIYKIIGKSNLEENNYQYCSNFHSQITRALEEKYGWEFIPTKDYEVFSNNKRFYLAIDSYCSNDFKNLEVELMATNYYSSQKAQDIFILDLLGLKLKEEKKLDLKNF